jgi:hypothetical protein
MQSTEDDRHPLRALDQTLLVVMVDLLRNSVLPGRPGVLTLEVFLCGLYTRYPEETKQFFRDAGRFSELLRKFYPERIRDAADFPPEELARVMEERSTRAAGKGRTLGIDIPLEHSLADALRNAARLAHAAGREKTALADFFEAVSRDEKLARRLYEETGLLLK